MRTPRVCHVSPPSIRIYRWMKAFAQRGYDISLISNSQTWVAPKTKSLRLYALPTLRKANFARQRANGLQACTSSHRHTWKQRIDKKWNQRPPIPTKNTQALAEKIIQLIENKDTRKDLGERCIRMVKQRASWENCVNRMEAVYLSML